MYRLMIVTVFACSSALTGCATQGLQNDQDRIRHTLLDLYTNQIMDNLIREYNGLPIIQLDYSNATAQLTIKETSGINNSLVTNNPGVISNIATSTATVLYSTVNTVTGNLTADRANQVAVTATPVTTSDEVYNAYREFLKIPGSLQEACKPPPAGVAHLCKKCGHVYYWVPAEYKKAFLSLALTTTAQRAQPLAAPDPFYAVKIVEVVSTESPKGVYKVVVKLDKKIPSDTGRIEIPGASSQASLTPTPDPAKPAPIPAQPTPKADGTATDNSKTTVFDIGDYQPNSANRLVQSDQIVLYFDAARTKGAFKDVYGLIKILPVSANVYLRNHRPLAPAVNDVQNRIEFQLQQIQFNQKLGGL